MPFSDADIRRQPRLGEDSIWEFKQIEFKGNRPVSPGRSDLADEIAAFANTDGGVLLCGVTDTGDVQGMSQRRMDELESLLVEVCTDTIKPPVRPVILRRELEEGKPFLVVEVPQGHARHDSPGGSFHRVGSSKRRMTSDERLRLAQRRGQARFLWFDKQAVPETGFRTLDESLWKPLLGYDRWLRVNTVKYRTHSLFRQGLMLYEHIPNWPEYRLRPLMEKFAQLLMEQRVYREVFAVI